MKRFAGLRAPTAGLARFAATPAAGFGWDDFGVFEAGAAKRELTAALVRCQHGLCAYCEIDLITDDTRLEHFVPRSDPRRGAALACDHANLLAVCRGGTNRDLPRERFLPPVRRNLSCDAAKQDRPAGRFLDPRTIPPAPPLAEVGSDGIVRAAPAACAEHKIPLARAMEHIDGLGLNVPRLRQQRGQAHQALTDAFADWAMLDAADRDRNIVAFARASLLPWDEGRLAPFFSTARSFFGPVAEKILAAPPQSWI